MKALFKIVGWAFAAFLLLAVTQEWEVFSAPWFAAAPAAPALSEAERQEAAGALELFVRLSGHYYVSAGDPRFAERLPASEGVVAELTADVEYLRRNRRLQEPQLARLEITAAERLAGGKVEFLTREWWHVRTISLLDQRDSDPPRAFRWTGRYLLAPGPQGWRVEGWEAVEEEAPDEGAPENDTGSPRTPP